MQELTTNPQGGLANIKTGEPIVYNKETIADLYLFIKVTRQI